MPSRGTQHPDDPPAAHHDHDGFIGDDRANHWTIVRNWRTSCTPSRWISRDDARCAKVGTPKKPSSLVTRMTTSGKAPDKGIYDACTDHDSSPNPKQTPPPSTSRRQSPAHAPARIAFSPQHELVPEDPRRALYVHRRLPPGSYLQRSPGNDNGPDATIAAPDHTSLRSRRAAPLTCGMKLAILSPA